MSTETKRASVIRQASGNYKIAPKKSTTGTLNGLSHATDSVDHALDHIRNVSDTAHRASGSINHASAVVNHADASTLNRFMSEMRVPSPRGTRVRSRSG
eukprot:1102721_1